ncbi:MAG: NfeD family protein [Bacillota bacterium]
MSKINSLKENNIFINLFFLTFLIFFFIFISGHVHAESDFLVNKNVDLVYQIPVKTDIDPSIASFVKNGIEEAEENEADLIIIEISSFGGLVDSAISIKDDIIRTSIPTITFVSERAWSAGALIALAGEELVMQEGTSIGAAETRPNEEKYISALRKEFNTTAELRNRNPELAEAMVDSDIEVEDIIAEGKLLTLTSSEALENNISNSTVKSYEDLLGKYKLINSEIITLKRSMKEIFADVVTTPIFSVILLSIGFAALISEAIIPGWGVGGTIGLLSLATFFSGYLINGYAHWGLIVLFIVGIVLMAIELFVVPGFGITGIGGLIAIFASLYFFFPDPSTALGVMAAVLVLSIALLFILIKLFGVSKFWKNISLGESQSNKRGYTSHSNQKKLIGEKGTTLTHLRPAGTAEFNGERIDVITEGDYIDRDQKVEVIRVKGSRVVVKKIEEE